VDLVLVENATDSQGGIGAELGERDLKEGGKEGRKERR